MGNRAIITTRSEYDNNTLGLYLHWNGGRDSVETFLAYCDLRGDRSPEEGGYGYARLAQVIGNWFGGALSIGIVSNPRDWTSGCDNGAYIVKDWRIVGREGIGDDFIEQNEYDMLEMMTDIDQAQPEPERLGTELISAYVLDRLFPLSYEEKLELLEIGSEVYVNGYDGWHKYTVLDFGEPDQVVNGQDVGGVPLYNYTAGYEEGSRYRLDENDPEDLEKLRTNPNSYLLDRKSFYLPNRPEHVKHIRRSLIDLI